MSTPEPERDEITLRLPLHRCELDDDAGEVLFTMATSDWARWAPVLQAAIEGVELTAWPVLGSG